MTDDDSLRDVVNDLGDSDLRVAIESRYKSKLKDEVGPFGEPLGDGLKEVRTGMRQYDHGQADGRKVREVGVKAVFDPERTEVDELQPGGEVRSGLDSLAKQHLDFPLKKIDLTAVTESEYIVWLVFDTSEGLTR